ncbi:MAG: universal stress protein [Proteobacteria bacterium]|nr:universal stress protein [Pseudomonadota bacterium]MBU2228235.1 universal stress protein [Pseudomonadota bacterium]MBU2261244.1 universal stress protein [Pseudomonadota bacterium]
MYQKILVPLDGSELAENALTQVRNLAGVGGVGEVTLLKVVEIDLMGLSEPPHHTRSIDLPALRKAHMERSQKYLEKIQSQLSSEGMKVKTETLEGRPAQTIVDYSQKNSMDLIVIATHGYSGMKRLMFGSVALRVLHDCHAPVLLIRPESCR